MTNRIGLGGNRPPRISAIVTLLALLPLCGPLALRAGELESTLELAVEQYQAALSVEDAAARSSQFEQAQLLFQKAVESIEYPSADLLVNLGNAALQSGKNGQAVVAYRQALQVQPGHRRAAANLEHVRGLLPEWIRYESSATWFDSMFAWNSIFRRADVAVGAAVFFLISAFLWAASIRWRSSILRNLALLPALAWLVLVVSLMSSLLSRAASQAVVISPEVIGRSADAASAAAKFTAPIPAGTEVQILEQRETWAQIQLANQQTAWVPAAALHVF